MSKSRFLIQNLLKGLVWLGILVVIYLVVKKYVKVDYLQWLAPVYEKPLYVYLIFIVSEVLIGIIPPEVFMMWALRKGDLWVYIVNVAALGVLSYAAGALGYLIGSHLNETQFYKTLEKNFFGKYREYLDQYGGFLIVVAALTPVPYSGICMLVGAMKYPFKKLLIYASTRFIRFSVYAYIIWTAHHF